jgi:hypothetical protein
LNNCSILPELAENQEQMTHSSNARERRISRRWEDNIKMNLRERRFQFIGLIQFVQGFVIIRINAISRSELFNHLIISF